MNRTDFLRTLFGGITAGLGALVGQPRAAGSEPITSPPVQDTQPGEVVDKRFRSAQAGDWNDTATWGTTGSVPRPWTDAVTLNHPVTVRSQWSYTITNCTVT